MEGVYIWGERLSQVNVMIHLLTGVFLLGAFTHHLWLVVRGRVAAYAHSVRRYSFWAVIAYLVCAAWGCFVYPHYRYYVRFLVQDQRAPWATAVFEIKEHWLAVGLALLPFYYLTSRAVKELGPRDVRLHQATVIGLNVIVWYSFIIGAIIVYIRGEW